MSEPTQTCDHAECCRFYLCGHPKCCGYAVPYYSTQRDRTDMLRDRIEAVLQIACHHCGLMPDVDGDHSCDCPSSDSECLRHTMHPVAPLDLIRATLAAHGYGFDIRVEDTAANPAPNGDPA